jgi:hypothetical protein
MPIDAAAAARIPKLWPNHARFRDEGAGTASWRTLRRRENRREELPSKYAGKKLHVIFAFDAFSQLRPRKPSANPLARTI